MAEKFIKKPGKYFLFFLILCFLFYLFYLLSDLIIIFIVSLLLAFIFDPFVKLLEKKGLNRNFSTGIVFIIIGFFLYFSLSIFLPKIYNQMNELINTFRNFSLHEQLVEIEKDIYKTFPFFKSGELSKKVEDFISALVVNSFDSLSVLISSIVSIVAILVIVPFITFFLLKDSQNILHGVLNVMPNKYFEMSYWILKKVSMQLGRFVRGWIFDATFVGLACGLGFYFIGIENALPLGIIAGLGHLVPYLGPVIGGLPAMVISIMQYGDLSKAPFLILLIAGVYTADNGFVQPYVFSKSVDMHPIVIILLIIAGSQLFGLLGMLLAVPTAAVFRTAAKEIYFAYKNYNISRL